ncbi:MAG: CoA transferase [Chloroflexi bacterium]|nr:CoA transferase [Chloroflexota bacterium]
MASDTTRLLPKQFGPLQGLRILSTGSLIAQPFAAAIAAEMGAEVIQIEPPKGGDAVWRQLEFVMEDADGGSTSAGWVQTRRNSFHTTLDLGSPKGQKIFMDLIPKIDIWMESSIPGTYDAWGLDDATVMAANPRLVVAHVSGYGQVGHPDYLGRASYDFIGQGFGGLMNLTGFPNPDPPMRAAPWTGDFITALNCLWSSLAGYIHSQKTGKGQVIDLAQFEAIHYLLSGTMVAYYEMGINRERGGNKAGLFQPYDVFRASDGWVNIAAIGSLFTRICGVLGLDDVEGKWQIAATDTESVEGIEFDAILRGWVEARTVKEVVEILNEAKVACCPIMTPKDMAEDPHYQARNVHIEWDDPQLGRKVKGTGVFPKFSDTPGEIWRGSVALGYDNDLVFGKLMGMSESEIAGLAEEGVI